MKVYFVNKYYYFMIPLPLSAIKWKWIWKIIKNSNKDKKEEINQLYQLVLTMYNELLNYKKNMGGFMLLDIDTNDIKIKIKI